MTRANASKPMAIRSSIRLVSVCFVSTIKRQIVYLKISTLRVVFRDV